MPSPDSAVNRIREILQPLVAPGALGEICENIRTAIEEHAYSPGEASDVFEQHKFKNLPWPEVEEKTHKALARKKFLTKHSGFIKVRIDFGFTQNLDFVLGLYVRS